MSRSKSRRCPNSGLWPAYRESPMTTAVDLTPVDLTEAKKYELGLREARQQEHWKRFGTIGYQAYVEWLLGSREKFDIGL